MLGFEDRLGRARARTTTLRMASRPPPGSDGLERDLGGGARLRSARQLRASRHPNQAVLSGFERRVELAQKRGNRLLRGGFQAFCLKRETGLEPATPGLGSQCSAN